MSTFHRSNPADLRQCPECGHDWPKDPDHSLRGAGWLYGLPRRVSPSNSDIQIHDGAAGRNRFLQLELKGPREPWPLQKGQLITLTALARLSNWTVRVLRGTTSDATLHRVAPQGIDSSGIRTHAEAVRRAVAAWLSGALWRDAEEGLAAPETADHIHGWARVEGVWTCIQDHRAVGFRPETACGETLPQFP